MFDIGESQIEIECGKCKRKHKVTLKQVTQKKIIKCLCGVNLELEDKDGSVARSIRDVNKSLGDLRRKLKRFGK